MKQNTLNLRRCLTELNLMFGSFAQISPLLDHMIPVHSGQTESDLTDDVVFGEFVEIIDLHHQCRLSQLFLRNLQAMKTAHQCLVTVNML